ASVNVMGKGSSLADSHAASHPKTAAAASAAASAAAAAAAAAAADSSASAAAAAAASAPLGNSFAEPRHTGVFLVEDVERRQADVGCFFLTGCARGRGRGPRRHIRRRHGGRCGRAARQRQRYADDSYDRYGLLATLSFFSMVLVGHWRSLPYLRAKYRLS